jgi:hypothetical protein
VSLNNLVFGGLPNFGSRKSVSKVGYAVEQSDQNGRIFTSWASVYFANVLGKVAQFSWLLIPQIILCKYFEKYSVGIPTFWAIFSQFHWVTRFR